MDDASNQLGGEIKAPVPLRSGRVICEDDEDEENKLVVIERCIRNFLSNISVDRAAVEIERDELKQQVEKFKSELAERNDAYAEVKIQ